MCNNFPNIRITEGNNFSIILPLRSRTYVATKPIDEDIDPEQLENVVVTFGGVEYPAQRTAQGVQIDLPATLAVGTYNILLTADYLESSIRAAYESAVTIVPWSAQSTAEQYIAGSPIVMRAAYVLSGVMTDAELEALKQEYREKNAQLQHAIEDAEEAKREWEQKAADLDGVAQQGTNADATNTAILAAVQQGGGGDARESTSQEILSRIGSPTSGQPTDLFAAILAAGGDDDAKQTIVDAINQMGGSATESMTWAQLAQQIIEVLRVPVEQNELISSASWDGMDLGQLLFYADTPIRQMVKKIYTEKVFAPTATFLTYTNLEEVYAPNMTASLRQLFSGCSNLKRADCRNMQFTANYVFQKCTNLHVVNLLNTGSNNSYYLDHFQNCPNLIDIIIGAAFDSNANLFANTYDPYYANRSDLSTLCFDTDLEEYGRTFATNFEKWKWCIINHFAANLQDRTGMNAYTITFNPAVLQTFDAEMIAAFTDKNWTLA